MGAVIQGRWFNVGWIFLLPFFYQSSFLDLIFIFNDLCSLDSIQDGKKVCQSLARASFSGNEKLLHFAFLATQSLAAASGILSQERGYRQPLYRSRNDLLQARKGLGSDGFLNGRQKGEVTERIDFCNASLDVGSMRIGHQTQGPLHFERMKSIFVAPFLLIIFLEPVVSSSRAFQGRCRSPVGRPIHLRRGHVHATERAIPTLSDRLAIRRGSFGGTGDIGRQSHSGGRTSPLHLRNGSGRLVP